MASSSPSHPPSMDFLLRQKWAQALSAAFGREAAKLAIGRSLDGLRHEWLSGGPAPDEDAVKGIATETLRRGFRPPLRRVINATGVVLHTNLGRAPLPRFLLDEAAKTLCCYVDLEMDVEAGERGHRDAKVESAFQELFHTDNLAIVTNNNASAVMLLLNTFSKGRETVVSRGELVEIGGGFRMPEVMAAASARLVEVGTTNKTRIGDYERAIGPRTGLLLKVHTSNFRVVGFTREVHLVELAELGRKRSLPVAFDLGSGLLLPPGVANAGDEPWLGEALLAAPDAICFSADKLLGGCQAGIVLAAPSAAAKIRANPLLRALRADKYTYFLLGGVLDLYRKGRWAEIPALHMLSATEEALKRRAVALRKAIAKACGGEFRTEIAMAKGRVGGGSAPLHDLASPAVAISHASLSAADIESRLRAGEPPIIAVVARDKVLFHLRTLLGGDDKAIVSGLAALSGEAP